jgi:hypothetical protein
LLLIWEEKREFIVLLVEYTRHTLNRMKIPATVLLAAALALLSGRPVAAQGVLDLLSATPECSVSIYSCDLRKNQWPSCLSQKPQELYSLT